MSSVRSSRGVVAVIGVFGALALTACSGGGDADDGAPTRPATSSAPTASAGGGAPSSASGDLQGSWIATTDGKAVALVVTGQQAALFSTGGTVCSGTAGEEAGMRMISLRCTDGKEDRATGMVDSVDKTSLTVTWEGDLGKETYTRAEDGQMPSGLPTAGLGS